VGPPALAKSLQGLGVGQLLEAVRTLLTGAATAKDASLSNGGMLTAVAVNPN